MLKWATPRELVEALHSLHAGGAPMSPKIARAIIRDLQDGGEEERFLLTPREVQILSWQSSIPGLPNPADPARGSQLR